MTFEDIPWTNVKLDTELFTIFNDAFPVTHGHVLFVPKINDDKNIKICLDLAYLYGKETVKQGLADGFNLGMNNGKAAGQTIMWPHIHVILRNTGDMEDPTGGVRHVIPKQGNYKGETYEQPTE